VKMVVMLVGMVLIVIVGGMIWARTASRPSNLGVQNGRLAMLPETPNGVATQSGNTDQKMAPIPYVGDSAVAQKRLMDIVSGMLRVEIVAHESGYVWAVFRSALFGFPDDVEFSFDDAAKVIHFRSASRLGYSDLGVNRKRMGDIRRIFEE